MKIPFNKPYLTGKEVDYINDAVASGHISGNGKYTKMCQKYFEERWGFKKTLLTASCTDALEMCALLTDIQPGDEVILPSYTFVSTALAFVRQGAVLKFADSRSDHPGMDEDKIEALITPNTKVIVVVHYAGVAADMDIIMALANKYNLFVVEDAAHAVDSYFTGKDGIKKPLGSIGHFGTFSFHETKNIQCGEGGLLAINDEKFIERAEIIWEKGTNRAKFFRGEIDKYGWVDIGSSFLPSDVTAAFLWAQLEFLDKIQDKRKMIWDWYNEDIQRLWKNEFEFKKPVIPDYATNNAYMYYLVFNNSEARNNFIKTLKAKDILAVFHYLSLHKSLYYHEKHDGRELINSDNYENCLVRLPLFYELNTKIVRQLIN